MLHNRLQVLVDLMDEVTVKLNSQEGSKAIAEVVFAEARMGWADERVQNLAAYYAAEHIQVGAVVKLLCATPYSQLWGSIHAIMLHMALLDVVMMPGQRHT